MGPLANSAVSAGSDLAAGADRPLDDLAFAAAIERLGPFERAPHIAVGVSGGSDSLALVLLADRWARGQGGRVTALVVDHGLRADSAAEAATVQGWLAARGIDCRVLGWGGDKPRSGVQAAAREARHRLLAEWCMEAGVLHLLLGHHRQDQRETALLRQEHKSGPDGLAAMSAIAERFGLRLLRPLLRVAPAALKATLRAAGQEWIEDPSNINPTFARVRLRERLGDRPAKDEPDTDLYGVARTETEDVVAACLARSVAVYPEGWARVDMEAWRGGDRAVVRRTLARLALTIGGGTYPPRGERLDRLLDALLAGELGGGRTLGGCRFLTRRGRLLVVREAAAARGRLEIGAPGGAVWDERFSIKVRDRGPQSLAIGALGADGWRSVAAAAPGLRDVPVPAAVRPTLPALFDLEGVLAVPHLSYRRRGADPDSLKRVSVTFCPRHALAGPGFVVN
jgi:tRNA(Ile)-lysidine synthase